jgi:hypothetical protein
MTQPEPWRRTGRKAKEDHWLGLEAGAVVEVSLYDDRGQQQGRGVIQLTARAIEDKDTEEGQTWRGQFLAIEDGYYEWWVENTYKMKILPFHFCARQSQQCAVKTLYREPIHIDVFRVIPEDGFLKLSWMTAEKKTEALKVFEAKTEGPGTGAARPGLSGVGTPGAGAPPEEVKEGEEGITGLARALGERVKESSRERGAEEEKPKKKCPRKEGDDKEEGLRAVISQRNAPLATGSALKMKGPSDKSKKRKRRDKRSGDRKERRKRRRDKEKNVDDETSEVSTPSTDSSEESLFQLAALPQGVDRLHRLHQERPGALANLTLQRFKELLERATGRGAAAEEVELPAVARAYLSQIYLARNPEGSLGLRNLRELRTLATMVDMVASNDPLRALDVALQRMKSIELFVSQGNWSQANLLELVMPEDEQRAWFRQELKAAQQEQKSELRLLHDQYPRRRTPWHPPVAQGGAGEKKDGEGKDETPPTNSGGAGRGRKGKGKGKKGKLRW